jgi:putative mycofactocin binding protein MftB
MIERSDTTNPKLRIQNLKVASEAHSALHRPEAVHSDMRFKTADGVQVRAEDFGLLFYNYRGPRLYFVPSQDLIDVDFFNGRRSLSGLIASICARKGWTKYQVEEKIMQVLAKLEDKGLINGQPIC